MPLSYTGTKDFPTRALAEASLIPLKDTDKFFIQAENALFDWVIGATFTSSDDVIVVSAFSTAGRFIKVGKFETLTSVLTTTDITAQLGSLNLSNNEEAELKFTVTGLIAGSNVNGVLTNMIEDLIPSGVSVNVQNSVDEQGKMTVFIRNNNYKDGAGNPLTFSIPELTLKVVVLMKNNDVVVAP